MNDDTLFQLIEKSQLSTAEVNQILATRAGSQSVSRTRSDDIPSDTTPRSNS